MKKFLKSLVVPEEDYKFGIVDIILLALFLTILGTTIR